MIQQSNALRRLEEVLSNALNQGDPKAIAGHVLLDKMQLPRNPIYVLDFYELLNQATEEAINIKNKPKLDGYIQVLGDLQEFFVVNHVWSHQWLTYSSYIDKGNIMNTLDALAEFCGSQNPAILLGKDFLLELNSRLNELLNETLQSDLSKGFKSFIVERIEDIISAIRRYHIHGSEGLEKAAKALIGDMSMVEHTLEKSDRNNPVYKKVVGWGSGILIFLMPTNIYDVIGVAPYLQDFLMPKIEEMVTGCENIMQMTGENSTIQDVFEKARGVFDSKDRKSLMSAKELKALPASKDASPSNSESSDSSTQGDDCSP